MWSVRERIAVFFNCAIAIALLSTSLGAHTQNGKPIFKPLHKIANRASIKDLKLYDCPKNVQCIDDISYFLDYAKLPHFGRERINSRLKQDLKFGEFIDTYIDMLKIPECKLSANIMLHALHIFNAVEIGFQNIDVNDEDEDAYQDTLKNVFLQVFNRGPKGLNKTIIEELETLKIVSTDGQNQKSIVECYFHQQAKVTNSSSSACYNTTTFVEKTFEILYHSMKAFNLMANRGVSTTFTAFDRRRINRTSKLLR